MSWTLVIHGGAGRIERARTSAEADAATRAALARALDTGAALLAWGRAALDTVEAAIRVLEDAPEFNAGHGAALTLDGRAELDAAIMDGADRRAGAVAGVTATRHPVTLARRVMTDSPHVMLAGAGADRFSLDHGLEQVEPAWFVTPERRAQLDEMLASDRPFDREMKFGTVGAVAVDAGGHVAAATSTGGVTGKRWGRVGDSPLVGAGTYADDRGAAVSCTGADEYFIRAGVAAQVSTRVRLLGQSLDEAVTAALDEMTALGGTGGLIAVAPGQPPAWRFTTPGMNRALATSDGERVVAMYGDE